MQEDLNDSRLVLCICSKGYADRSELPSIDVSKEIKVLEEKNEKGYLDYIIPVIKNNPKNVLPKIFSSHKFKYINADKDNYEEDFIELINRLSSEDLRKIPEIVSNPFSNKGSTELDMKVIDHEVMYHNPSFEGTVKFNYKDNDDDNGKFVLEFSYKIIKK